METLPNSMKIQDIMQGIDDIITEIKKENFEGIVLHTGKNALTAPEISVFQLDANGIRIQFKSKGEDRT